MSQYLVRRGTKGWMIWDRNRKHPAIARQQELINFASSQEAQAILEDHLARGFLVDTIIQQLGHPTSKPDMKRAGTTTAKSH